MACLVPVMMSVVCTSAAVQVAGVVLVATLVVVTVLGVYGGGLVGAEDAPRQQIAVARATNQPPVIAGLAKRGQPTPPLW
jgi:uncharacterized membrane protein